MTDERAMTGRLAGIARHAVPKGPMEVIDTAIVTPRAASKAMCAGGSSPAVADGVR